MRFSSKTQLFPSQPPELSTLLFPTFAPSSHTPPSYDETRERRTWQINLNVLPVVLHIHINITWLPLAFEFIGFPPLQIRATPIDEYFNTCALCGTFIIGFAIINRINEQSEWVAECRNAASLHLLCLCAPPDLLQVWKMALSLRPPPAPHPFFKLHDPAHMDQFTITPYISHKWPTHWW